jgi:hypothetical protein
MSSQDAFRSEPRILLGGPAYVLNEELADDLGAGRRRHEWMWMALRDDHLVARLAWWASQEGGRTVLLDVFDIDDIAQEPTRVDIGVGLLQTAMAKALPAGTRPPEYIRFVPPNWRDGGMTRRPVEARMAALERTGTRLLVERLRLQWQPGTRVPATSGRLRFRPVGDREELVGLMTLVLDGTLDAHSRSDLARKPAGQVAAEQYDGEFLGYDSPRDWWRVATLPDAEPVGFVIPARNSYNPIIAYLGLVPANQDPRGAGHPTNPGGY